MFSPSEPISQTTMPDSCILETTTNVPKIEGIALPFYCKYFIHLVVSEYNGICTKKGIRSKKCFYSAWLFFCTNQILQIVVVPKWSWIVLLSRHLLKNPLSILLDWVVKIRPHVSQRYRIRVKDLIFRDGPVSDCLVEEPTKMWIRQMLWLSSMDI